MKSRTSIRAVLAALCVLFASAAVPSLAQANEQYYFGNATTNYDWPFCGSSSCNGEVNQYDHLLTESDARTINGNTVCSFSYDNPSLQPTAVVCSGSLAVKSLCGCVARFAASRSTVNGAVPRGRAESVY